MIIVPISAKRQREIFTTKSYTFNAKPAGKREISRATTPLTRCPPCCRLWADVWPRRAEVGYGYHPAYLGACWGAFRCAESEAGERGGVVPAPPRSLLPTVRAVSQGQPQGS